MRTSFGRRGVALMLAMIALIVSATVGYSYLASQGTAIGIGRNIREQAQARYAAECGLEVAIAAIKGNSDWRTQQPHGTWVANVPVAGELYDGDGVLLPGVIGDTFYTIVVQDGIDANGDGVISVPGEGDGSLANNSTDPITISVTGSAGHSTAFLREVLRIVANSSANVGNEAPYGTAERNVSGMQIATQVTVTTGGTLTSISLYADGPPPKKLRLAIYSDVNGEPGNLLAQTSASGVGSNSAHWVRLNVTGSPVSLSEGTYWLAFAFEHSNINFYYASSGGQTRTRNYNAVANGFTSLWGASATMSTRRVSIYATLSADGYTLDLK